ncbi:Uncharacterised protein [Bordetella pertussis]|nr:Uncharacterised protein [Bordetella pertussis]CFN54750.1 Uncharacterised protein [Bordetella pertussis]CFO01973.1 Uncharacterised protein [Bordetella pertussis]CFO30123.1 Uncharacterised protein [Bordetella pertussis]CFP07451.1 Uncharacterised protein [Bordetella pertussis]
MPRRSSWREMNCVSDLSMRSMLVGMASERASVCWASLSTMRAALRSRRSTCTVSASISGSRSPSPCCLSCSISYSMARSSALALLRYCVLWPRETSSATRLSSSDIFTRASRMKTSASWPARVRRSEA